VWNPHDGYRSKWLGYLGETERLPIERIAEHLRAAYPWGDTVVSIEVDDRLWPDKASVVRAERAAVEAEQPLYNDEYNRRNPLWIPYEVQVLQRHARDRAEGRPLWRPNQSRRPRAPRVPAVRPAWWRRSRWTGWHVAVPAWLLLSALGWGLLSGPWDAATGAVPELQPAAGWSPLPAAVLALIALVWAVGAGGRWWRRRRRGPWWWPW
jgi:hypothetical protein